MDEHTKATEEKTNENPRGSDHTEQGKATFNPGSTTQAGSDFGQGSSNLGPESYKQGSEKNEGSNYDNESTSVPAINNNQDIESGLANEKDYDGPNENDPGTNT